MKSKEELEQEKELLKSKYKPIYTIEVALNEEETEVATIYLKKADRQVYASVGKLAQGNDPLRAVEMVLKNCYVGGDELELILKNDDALMSCEGAVVEMLDKKKAVLKKN